MDKSEIGQLLEDIGLPTAEANVYIALLDGAQSVSEIIKLTGEKRPTIYYSLNSLEKRGLVTKTGKAYGNKFQIGSITLLETLVQGNIRKQESLLEKAIKLRNYYPNETRKSKTLVSYFESVESIKQAIFSSLYTKEKTIRSIVPAVNYFNEMGGEFVLEYVTEKQKRNLKTIALWEDIPNKKIITDYYELAEIRQLPITMHNSFDTTIFIYDNKTLYVSSKREQYAVLIESNAHSKMMKVFYDTIWNNSLAVT